MAAPAEPSVFLDVFPPEVRNQIYELVLLSNDCTCDDRDSDEEGHNSQVSTTNDVTGNATDDAAGGPVGFHGTSVTDDDVSGNATNTANVYGGPIDDFLTDKGEKTRSKDHKCTRGIKIFTAQPGLTRACRQIREECLPMYYKINRFCYNSTIRNNLDDVTTWLEEIGSRNRALVTRISIRVYVTGPDALMIGDPKDPTNPWSDFFANLKRLGCLKRMKVRPSLFVDAAAQLTMPSCRQGSLKDIKRDLKCYLKCLRRAELDKDKTKGIRGQAEWKKRVGRVDRSAPLYHLRHNPLRVPTILWSFAPAY